MKQRKKLGRIEKRIVAVFAVCAVLLGAIPTGAYAEGTLPSGIKITNGKLSINVNETLQMKYEVTPATATDKSVTWASSDPGIATVSKNGVVKGIGTGLGLDKREGAAVITATSNADPAVSGSCTVTVNYIAPTSMTILPPKAALANGESVALSATFTPLNTSNKKIKWESADTNIATVSADGKVTAVKAFGYDVDSSKSKTVKIKAQTDAATSANKKIEAICEVTVTPTLPSSIRLSPSSMTLVAGRSGNFDFFLTPAGAMVYGDTAKATIVKNENNVVSKVEVKEGANRTKGIVKVTTKENTQGTAIIKVKERNGTTDTCIVNVVSALPTLTPSDSTKVKMSKKQVKNSDGAECKDEKGNPILEASTKELVVYVDGLPASEKIIWESSDKAVAKVKSDGKVAEYTKGTEKKKKSVATITAVGYGECKITARSSMDSGLKKVVTFDVNVVETLPKSYVISPATKKIREGHSSKLDAPRKNLNPKYADVKWDSKAPSVATVSSAGVVTGVSPGQAEISLKTAKKGTESTCTVTVTDRYANGDIAKATAIGVNTVVSDACLYPANDKDFFCFKVKTKSYVTVNLENVPNGCDYDLYLYNTKKNEVQNTTRAKGYKSITWEVGSNKYYYVEVRANGEMCSPEYYKLQLLADIADNMPTSVTIEDAPENALKFGDTVMLTAQVNPSSATNQTVIWSSSDTSLATVSETGLVRVATSAEEATVTITARTSLGSRIASCDINIKNIPVESISILPEETVSAVGVNGGILLTARLLPHDASNKSVAWSSSDSSIADVSAEGLVTGKKEGTAFITATTDSGRKTAVREVNVVEIPPESLTLSQTALDLKGNAYFWLVATILPDTTSDKSVLWESDNPAVVAVDGGMLYGREEGTAVITATSNADALIKGTCAVTVTVQPPTGISVYPAAMEAVVGDTKKINAVVQPGTASDKSIGWSSSNPAVAEVSESGEVTAISEGSAVITATPAAGASGTCAVTVKNETRPETVTVSKKKADINIGKTLKLTAKVLPETATNKNVRWSSSDTYVATVSSNGTVTGKGEGKATITATTVSGGKSDTCTVEVKSIAITDLSIYLNGSKDSVPILYMGQNKKHTLVAKIQPSDASCQDVSWSSSDTSVAVVSAKGTVTTNMILGERAEWVTTITAEATSGEKAAVCEIRVLSEEVKPGKVKITKKPSSVLDGSRTALTATVSPIECTNKQVEWTCENDPKGGTKIAKISTDGVLTAKATGTVKVTAKAAIKGADGKAVKKTVKIKINPATPTGVSIKAASTMRVGEKQTLTVSTTPEKITRPKVDWTVDKEERATISANGELTAKSAGKVTVKATVYSGDEPKQKKVKSKIVDIVVDPDTLSIIPNQAQMEIKEKQQLKVEIEPEGAKNRNVKWRSSNPSIAKVSQNGMVTAIESGTVTITASIASVKDAPAIKAGCEIEVKVKKPEKIEIMPLPKKKVELCLGEKKKLSVKFTKANSTKTLFWSSYNPSIVEVDAKTGVIKGIKPGETTIEVCSLENVNAKDRCEVVVKKILPKDVTLAPKKVTLYTDDTQKLTAKVLPANSFDPNVTWSSDNEGVATVSKKGIVTAHKPGQANITATTKTKGSDKKYRTKSCTVTVKAVAATSLSVKPKLVKINAGGTQQLSISMAPKNVTDRVPVYKSSNNKIAIVSESGLVTGLKKGKATISAKAGGKTETCEVEVTTNLPEGIELSPTEIDMDVGEKATINKAKVLPKDTIQGVTYTSSNPQVATVSSTGEIKAVGAGACEIIVRAKAGNFEGSCVVQVFDQKPVSMKAKKTVLSPSGSKNLLAEATLPKKRKDNTKYEWIWGSSAPDVAEVTQQGMVTAKQPGVATIMAYTLQGDSAAFEIEVK